MALAVMATGCAPALHLREPAGTVPARFAAPGADTADLATLDRWWVAFDDAQLSGLIEQALANGNDARLALARLREARAIRRAALARFAVQGDVQATGSFQRSKTLSGDSTFAGGTGAGTATGLDPSTLLGGDNQSAALNLSLSWEIDLFGRRGATRRGADADLAAARFLYEGSRVTLAADVADTLFSLRGLAVQLADARETTRIQRDLREVAADRVRHGLAPDIDVARIDADLRQAEAQEAQLDAELIAGKRALLVLTGAASATTDQLVVDAVVASAPAVPATLPGDLLERRPDIREAEARFRAAVATTQVQRLDLFPRLTLTPGVGLSAAGGSFDYSLVSWTLGGGIALPLLDRPRLLAQLDAQTARAEQAAVSYEKMVQTAFSEADQALVQVAAAHRRIDLLTAGEARAALAYEGARMLFGRGLTDFQTLLDAERIWRAARQALATARTEGLRRTVAAFRALGGGWDIRKAGGA